MSRSPLHDARPALGRLVATVRPHLRPHRRLVAGGMAAMVAEVAFRLMEPWPIKVVVDAVAGGGRPDLVGLLLLMALAVVLAAGGRAGANYLAVIAFALAGSRAATAIRAQVFDRVQALSIAQHGRLRVGDLVQRLIGDVGRLQEVAVTAGLPLLGNLLTFVAMIAVMVWLDPLLASAAVIATAGFALLSRRRSGAITAAARRTRRSEGDLASQVAEAVGALPVVQALGLEDEVRRPFDSANKRSLKEGVKARRLAAGLERRTDVLVAVSTAVVLGLGGWRVQQGALSVGDLVVFLTYLKSSMKPLRDLAKYTGRIAKAAAAGERVTELLGTTPEIADRPDARDAGRLTGLIELDGVGLAYRPEEWVLRDVDLRIEAGEHVGVIGPSGGGKSSLAALLLRLLDPVEGQLRYDGLPATSLALASLRRQIAYVPQEPVLFAVSMRENIRYGRLDASDADVEQAARRARVLAFAQAMPEGLDTVLQERGKDLSGGQRQRIAVARALLSDAPIVVLDEATSALDPANVAEVRAAIAELTAGRTTISITHDRSAVIGFDRVLRLASGTVEELAPEAARAISPPRSRG